MSCATNSRLEHREARRLDVAPHVAFRTRILVSLTLLAAFVRAAHAQAQGSFGLGVGTVRYTGGTSVSTASFSPAWTFDSPNTTLSFAGTLASVPLGVWSSQGRADLWLSTPPAFGGLRFGLQGTAAGTARTDGDWTAATHGVAELLWAGQTWGVGIGAGPSAGWIANTSSVTALHTRARAWWQAGTLNYSVSLEPTRSLGAWFTDATAASPPIDERCRRWPRLPWLRWCRRDAATASWSDSTWRAQARSRSPVIGMAGRCARSRHSAEMSGRACSRSGRAPITSISWWTAKSGLCRVASRSLPTTAAEWTACCSFRSGSQRGRRFQIRRPRLPQKLSLSRSDTGSRNPKRSCGRDGTHRPCVRLRATHPSTTHRGSYAHTRTHCPRAPAGRPGVAARERGADVQGAEVLDRRRRRHRLSHRRGGDDARVRVARHARDGGGRRDRLCGERHSRHAAHARHRAGTQVGPRLHHQRRRFDRDDVRPQDPRRDQEDPGGDGRHGRHHVRRLLRPRDPDEPQSADRHAGSARSRDRRDHGHGAARRQRARGRSERRHGEDLRQ